MIKDAERGLKNKKTKNKKQKEKICPHSLGSAALSLHNKLTSAGSTSRPEMCLRPSQTHCCLNL
jgi:hypothetical protein